MLNKEIIKNNFSKYAKYYDSYSTIQNLCALRLIEMVRANGIGKILDIGCGTGNYTKLLRHRFPSASIKAVDISKEMVGIAEEKLPDRLIEFIIADAESVSFKEKFDFVSSNASFQWFEDLETALLRYRGLLSESGIITFSTFGPLTFYELNSCLKELFGDNALINSTNFMEKPRVEELLKATFREAEVEEEIYKERHITLSELLRKIKYSGIRGVGISKKGLWTSKIMDELERVYRVRFEDIIVTYQVFFCKAKI